MSTPPTSDTPRPPHSPPEHTHAPLRVQMRLRITYVVLWRKLKTYKISIILYGFVSLLIFSTPALVEPAKTDRPAEQGNKQITSVATTAQEQLRCRMSIIAKPPR